MARAKDTELRLRGLGLGARFAATMTLALAIVLAIAGFLLHAAFSKIAENVQQRELLAAVLVNAERPPYESVSDVMRRDTETGVEWFDVRYGEALDQRGVLYRAPQDEDDESARRYSFLVPDLGLRLGDKIALLLVALLVTVCLVAAGVAFWVAGQVTRPIHKIVDVVRQVAKGDLGHRVRVHGSGEVELLARSVDRMAGDLAAAQEAELELSIREREMQVAAEVRGALLPMGMPEVAGYEFASGHFASDHPGGDWHDFVDHGGGGVGVLVAEVSGQGVPASVVGATARAYLRSELSRDEDVEAALLRVNAALGADVRRGMFVTALYVRLRPNEGTLTVVSAGHKIPLIVLTRDGKVRTVHPGGIALGLDRGPVFQRALEVRELELELGERLVLTTTGPIGLTNPRGEELGEKRFYSVLHKCADAELSKFVPSVRRVLEKFSGDESFPVDISIVTLERTA